MKPNSIQINSSRGEIVDETALIASINEKNIRAGLDVFCDEPTTGTGEFSSELAQHPNLIGVKECAGNERMSHYESKGIACWSGNDDQCFEGRHRHGSHGVISVISNLMPGLMRQLMDNDDPELNVRLQPLMDWLGIAATTRASFGMYNTKSDVDALLDGLNYVKGDQKDVLARLIKAAEEYGTEINN